MFRYRGKKSPDAILADICWWSKTLYEDEDEEEMEDLRAEDEFDEFIASDDDDDDSKDQNDVETQSITPASKRLRE